jgi:aryl-alcohol dehydrogenase-like predicted oxidoreductase/enamine deaminase RidA (YjgF/YER057c/UK114 family)
MSVTYHQLTENLKISKVVTGLWQIADMERDGIKVDKEVAANSMSQYVEHGLTSFDMADHYGSAEDISGFFYHNYFQGQEAQFFTKWVPKPGFVDKATIRKAVTDALSKLQTDQLDLLQYHAWSYLDPIWLDTLFELEELKKEGLIGALGVTNFDAEHLRVAAASGIKLVSNQVSYSLLDQRATYDMKEVCSQYGIKLLAFGTLGGGLLSDRWLGQPQPENMETWSQMKYHRFVGAAGGWDKYQSMLQKVKKVAEKHQTSIANIASGYILQQPHVAAVIIGARLGQSEHLSDTLRLFNLQLDNEDQELLDSALSSLDPIPGDCGDEYRKPPFLTASGDLSHHIDQIPAPYTPEAKKGGGTQIFSGTVWEGMAGYSRAVRKGNRISVSGTTATHEHRMIGGNDPGAQATFVLDKIQGAIESLGGKLEDVVRTRIFVNNIDDWEPVARAHGRRFKEIQPANTLVEAKLVGEGYLVEIEAEAEL